MCRMGMAGGEKMDAFDKVGKHFVCAKTKIAGPVERARPLLPLWRYAAYFFVLTRAAQAIPVLATRQACCLQRLTVFNFCVPPPSSTPPPAWLFRTQP